MTSCSACVAMGILNAAMHRAGAVGVSLTYVTGVLVKFAQGLGHAVSPSCTSIMQQGFLSINKPQPHDFYDFDQLYPGSWSYGWAC